jgi:MFS transporter, PHS family, inorganic phosphate transporter
MFAHHLSTSGHLLTYVSQFIIPAEIFPTRYRCTCHGIAAASGKLGAVVVQFVFLGYEGRELQKPNSKAIGKIIIIFAAFMLLGAIFAWAWIPAVQRKSEDVRLLLENIDLETLAKGEERLPTDEKVGFRNKLRSLRPRKAWHKRRKGEGGPSDAAG